MHPIISVILSLLILSGSMNISLAKHYCGGKLKEAGLTFGQDFKGCGMENDEGCAEFLTIPCCENHFQELSLEDEYSASFNPDLKASIIALIPVLYPVFLPFYGNSVKFPFYYHPPDQLTEVFLPLTGVFII
jgi:hypothetical protein